MRYSSFDQLIEKAKNRGERIVMAVAGAEDAHAAEAALEAEKAGIVTPVLIYGDTPEDAAEKAVRLVREGRAGFILKGAMDTRILLKAVVNSKTGLSTGRLMSHFTIFEIPSYHKLLAPLDGGMVPYPDLSQKADIIRNAVDTMSALGIDNPKVGILACAEKINPKMPETIEADMLKQMNLRGEIPGCIVEGPISYDCAVSKEIAAYKHFESPCAGDCDILKAPDIHAGNIIGKILTVTCKAKMCGFIVGASCPIAMTSRGSTSKEKFCSIAVASLAARQARGY